MVRVKAERAAALVAAGKVTATVQPGLYVVTGRQHYCVDLDRQNCTCPDHQRGNRYCKHLMAATLYHAQRKAA